eukprot:gnl/MRDRNA2_/MRDRNA2_124070_c0_seq1.p1 gnl/MRDRNA2_/MRDRNA2_124070_c0~~gnl/MRDRNA2_/MRDRNA2_124070_c0_seq1.p1  ORF type:complete len:597 (+),score=81.20 gnl/MRDRNA2_/MRDRNA2_124070_c0_seq1:242-1792(+)
MQRVLEVNDQEETFKAIFSVRLEWIDPGLANKHSQILVRRADGSIDEFSGYVRERPRRDLVLLERDGPPGKPSVEERLRPWDIVRYSAPDGYSIVEPKIRFENAIDTPSIISEDQRLLSTGPAGGVICVERQYVGSFADKLDLRMFPWDRQLLQIRVVADSPLEEVRLLADGRKSWTPQTRPVPQGWRLSEEFSSGFNMFERPFDVGELQTAPQFQLRSTVNSEIRMAAHLERIPSKYTRSSFLSVFLCNLAACICVLLKVEDAMSRGGLQLLSLLILFVQRLLVNDCAPRKSYQSLLDCYFTIALLMQASLIFQNVYLVLWSGHCHSVREQCQIGSGDWLPEGRACSSMLPREAFYCDAQAVNLDRRFYGSISTLWLLLNLCLVLLSHRPLFRPWQLVYQHCHLDPAVARAVHIGVRGGDEISSWPGCFTAGPSSGQTGKRPPVTTPKKAMTPEVKASGMALPPPSSPSPRTKYITPEESGRTCPEFYEVPDDTEEGPGAAAKGIKPLLVPLELN